MRQTNNHNEIISLQMTSIFEKLWSNKFLFS